MNKTRWQNEARALLDTAEERLETELTHLLQEIFEEGFDRGAQEAEKGSLVESDELRKRFHYLTQGGRWDVTESVNLGSYCAGFLDAMKTVGVKP